MALKSPMIPSPSAGFGSAFSPYGESPRSPMPQGSIMTAEQRSSGPSDSLAPPPSPYPQHVDPSPVDSNGTESTEIEEDAQEGVKSPLPQPDNEARSPGRDSKSPESLRSPQSLSSPYSVTSPREEASVTRLQTRLEPTRPNSADDAPPSVIHAPTGFKKFPSSKADPDPNESVPEHFIASPSTPEAILDRDEKRERAVSPVNTNVAQYMDRSTPRAQTRQELDDDWSKRSTRSRRTSSLEDIPEALDKDGSENDDPDTAGLVGEGSMSQTMHESLTNAEQDIEALRTALSECWTLCNTLASLSSSHRQRTFKHTGKEEVQQQAWRSCWRLCQQLYESRDKDHASQVAPTLELCREFCQSLFDVRLKGDEASDSVLRVSFELNNHLYNTHDRSLPEAFNERTLDFYITLCHRLMKQRTCLSPETDALLRACWPLAEMLFNLRQNNREGKNSDEELLGSAVQACWELCDLFREGWTQIRPERNTPRPSQTTFGSQVSRGSASSHSTGRSNSSLSNRPYHDAPQNRGPPPETPTTIFDDSTTAASSPDSVNIPNILVLGPGSRGSGSVQTASHHERWSSNASVLSGYSDSTSSQRTSSTATATTEDAHLTRLRCLLLRAGMNTGFNKQSGQTLPAYARAMSENAFGELSWQRKVLSFYKKLVMGDKSMLTVNTMHSRRLGANEVAKSVKWLGNSEQWAWMRDLYRLVFGFGIDEVDRIGGSFTV